MLHRRRGGQVWVCGWIDAEVWSGPASYRLEAPVSPLVRAARSGFTRKLEAKPPVQGADPGCGRRNPLRVRPPRSSRRAPFRRQGHPQQDQAARGLLERMRVRGSRRPRARGGSTLVGENRVDLPLPAERHRRIQEFLLEHRAVRVSTLAELLGVSEVTIRRDLEDLERRGLLERNARWRAVSKPMRESRLTSKRPYAIGSRSSGSALPPRVWRPRATPSS